MSMRIRVEFDFFVKDMDSLTQKQILELARELIRDSESSDSVISNMVVEEIDKLV